jgi:hypothetical protein
MPIHKDPLMYGWTMVSNVHRLLSAPRAIFHGNTFYPHGNSIAYTDLLLTPTLTAGPIYLLTGNPVLQYNLTLLLWWALSGWAMYVLAYALLRSHPGAAIAAIVFTLSPFRTDFFLEFQMQLGFPIPLAVLSLLRFLESARWRYLAALVLLVWVEALASMYYAIILGLCLVVLAGLHAILRSGAWSRALVARGVVATLVLAALLGPFVVPYVQNRRELGMERQLHQPPKHSADVLTYLETGVARLYRFRPTGHIAETSLFMGFVALGLAAVGCIPKSHGARRSSPAIRRGLVLAMGAAGGAFALSLAWHATLPAVPIPVPGPQTFLYALLFLGIVWLGLEGWEAARAGEHAGPLGERELVAVCLFLIVLFFDLSLGPTIFVARHPVGTGLYAHLYPYLLPLHAMRITSRIGVVVVLGVGLLAGLGLKRLLARLPGPRAGLAVAAACALALLAEYHSFPLPYQRIDWSQRPPVYQALAADPDDVAVLEWPLGGEYWDDYFTFMTIGHWKRLVNGASGFLPRMTHEISRVLSRPEAPGAPFPSGRAIGYLTGIHPLRYVVVHNDLIAPEEQRKWARLREVPWARLVGTFGAADLYRLSGEVSGGRVEKIFSWDYARGRGEIAFEARAVGPPADERWVEIELGGRSLGRRPITVEWTPITVPLVGHLSRSAPNTVTLLYRYRPPAAAARAPIGRTGVLAPPADLFVFSGGFTTGDRASVLVNMVEQARDLRGYNVVALEPATGQVLWSDAFDTHASEAESRRLAEALGRVRTGTVVVAAVKDEASQSLSGDAVAALRSVGAGQDLRRRYRASHLLVGVKGAPPGTALEESGDRPLDLTLGAPPDRVGMEVRDFTLR